MMSKLSKSDVVNRIIDSGMIPVFNHPDVAVCKSVLKACYDGGLRVFEFTNRSEGAYEVFAELKKYTSSELPDMLLGAGSIIEAETTQKFVDAGADFIVSPAMVEDMAVICNQNEIAWSPGCGTVTEVVKAHNLGSDLIKLFPGSQVGGPGFVRAVLAPLPFLNLMPTGGVSPDRENLLAWFDAGVACVGMGSKLFRKEWILQGEYDKISQLVADTLSLINEIRNR
jgi:2-dehydro-3-deoxyphosphogluconate aldolase/(4S)-4-hydroxy-2-oxoglutarate aldolase